MEKRQDADVIIAGGGMAGAAAALSLATAGASSRLLDPVPVERRASAEFDGRALALGAASVALLRAVGVWDAVAAHAEPMRAIELHDGRIGAPGPARLRFEGDGGEPFAWLVETRFLRPALLDAVAAEPLVQHDAPSAAAAVRPDAHGATVELREGGTLRAAFVVAADGRRSPLAAAAGLSWASSRYDQVGLVCAVSHETPHDGLARQIFYPGGPFAMLPLRENRTSIVWSERRREAERIAGLDDAGYAAEVAARTGGLLGKVRLEGGRWSWPLEAAVAYAFVGPRLALLGDAAHSVHPIAGQGFNLALRDAAALAETVGEALRRGEDVGSDQVLARYQRWRRFEASAFAGATDGLNRLFSTDRAALRALRDAGLGLVDAAPALKRAFVDAAAGRLGDVPRLLRGEAP